MLSDLVVKYGYLMVVAGVIVEGDATVVTAAFLAHRGYLKLGAVIALAAITSMTMNQIYFRLGRRHGVDHVAKADGRKLFRNIVHHTRKHAIWLILLSRFVFGFRMAIPATVWALGMSTPRFLVTDFAGSIIWAVAMAATGYAAGHVGQLLIGNEWEVGFVLMALTLGWGVYRRRHVQQVTTIIDRTDALVGHPGGDEVLKVDEARVLDDE
jgi:membrane protein DedA with SNARE-associated domain